MTPPRVAIIGGRRGRQGLGPYFARDLRAAGADVPCLLATSEATCREAAEQMAAAAGVRPRGYCDLEALLGAEEIDALVIATPHESHLRFLEAAVEAGLHALCEKPLLWGAAGLAARAADLVARFDARGLLLVENCQWPLALPAFERLHPGATSRAPARLRMLLQPAGAGARMLADSLPHPLSLLQRLAPGSGRVEDLRFAGDAPESLAVRFVWCAGAARVETEVELRRSVGDQPRETRLEIDGRAAQRRVDPSYRLSFCDGGRTVALEDPLTLMVAGFVDALVAGPVGTPPEAAREIVDRVRLLEEITAAYERGQG